uniref:Arf-GAP domain-containing protein n=1 Tax=Anopheles culicifacies TaxID=139723 RepID=A0A182MX27_9DIPT
MATFTQEEIEFLKQNGNDNCSRTWLGLWDPKRAIKQEHRDFMIDKYERKRYYLEPASPLKSLPTNASSSLTSLSGGSSRNANESLVPLKTPTLTPPATLRLNRTNSGSCNGLNNVNSSSSSLPGAMGVGTQFQQQFTPDDSGFFGSADPPKILPPTPQKNHVLQRKNGIKIKQPSFNGLPPTYGRNQKNGLLNSSTAAGLSGSSGDINANKFTPDADFVADFGSATIVNNVSNGGSHYGSTSSLKNGHNNSDNGGGLYALHNGNSEKTSTREMENFADFDHNPIFNSAGLPMPIGSNSSDSKLLSNGKNSSTSIHSTPSVDRYAALKDLDNQFREIKLEQQAEANNNTITSNGLGNVANINDSITPTSSANPFKTANPFQTQQQQQQQHAQQQTMAWPISGINGTSPDARHQTATNGNGFYATSPYQGGIAHGASTQLYNGNVVNGSTIAAMNYLPPAGYHPNGNGYSGMTVANGVLMGGQFNGTSNGGASMLSNVPVVTNPVHNFANFGNPFMAAGTTAGNSNNPFL